jgi:hypothetical protein
MGQEHVPRPARDISRNTTLNLRSILELITKSIDALRLLEIQLERRHVQGFKRVKLFQFRDPVVVRVLPEPQAGKDRVALIDQPIAIASVDSFVKFRQGQKSVLVRRWWLQGKVTKQFSAIIDGPVCVAIQCEPRVI